MLQYSLIQFAHHLGQIPTLQLAKAPHTITEPPLCFMAGVIQCIAALSPTFRRI